MKANWRSSEDFPVGFQQTTLQEEKADLILLPLTKEQTKSNATEFNVAYVSK